MTKKQIEDRLEEIMLKATSEIDLDILFEYTLTEEEQEEYYTLREMLHNIK